MDGCRTQPVWNNVGGSSRQEAVEHISVDPRITLLFDLNGMLVQLHGDDQPCEEKPFQLRPGFKHVLSLLPHFRVGLYTSSNLKNVKKRVAEMVAWLRSQRGLKAVSVQEHASPFSVDIHHPSFQLFEVLMPRHYCKPDEDWSTRIRGKPWDTVKPLADHGLELSRTILMDDSEFKVIPGEKANVLILPSYLAYSHPDFIEEAHDTIHAWGSEGNRGSMRCCTNGAQCMGCTKCSCMPVMNALCTLLRHHLLPESTPIGPARCFDVDARGCEAEGEVAAERRQNDHVGENDRSRLRGGQGEVVTAGQSSPSPVSSRGSPTHGDKKPRDVRDVTETIRDDLNEFLYGAQIPSCLSHLRATEHSCGPHEHDISNGGV